MTTSYKQPAHKLLTIPGPIEVSDDVLLSNASPSVSHVGPAFSKIMKESLAMLQKVLYTTSAQPFLVAGSGTLGWDMVSSNLVEPGENVLVLHSGYFGDAFADCLEVYGAKVKQIKAPVGAAVTQDELEKELKSVGEGHYKLVTFTHCDTSTGVLANAKNVCETVKRLSPGTLTILDGVCSVGSEEIRMDDWGVDVVLTASQKGLGVPPGLCIVLASQKAMKVLETRKTPVTSYFASWKKWQPIMQAYQSGGAAYFATPPLVHLITALHTSLTTITTGSPNLEQRFAAHKAISQKIKKTVQDMGLKLLPLDPEFAANGMTAIWAPDGLKPTDIVPKMLAKDVIVAAGLHKDCKEKYFRIGHMGVTVVDDSRGDVDKILTALKESLTEAGYQAPSSVSA